MCAVKKLFLFVLLLMSSISIVLGQSLAIDDNTWANGATGITVTVTGTNTIFPVANPCSTAFYIVGYTGASITSQNCTSNTSATLVISAGTTNGVGAIGVFVDPGCTNSSCNQAIASFTVQPTFSANQTFVVNGTTTNVTFTGIGASWTSSTAFAFSGCPTASIISKSVPNPTTAILNISAGTTDCTITVTDPSTSNTTTLPVYTRQAWFVRPDGGTRFSTNIAGQCNGMYDVSYAVAHAATGGTTNLNCAFDDVRYLWQDGSQTYGFYMPNYGWLPKGGDIITIRGSISDGITYRLGWNTSSGCLDSSTGIYWGICADSEESGMPPPPSGISTQHTVIQGGNYSNCSLPTASTQLHGGWGLDATIILGKSTRYTSPAGPTVLSDYLDLNCLDITDFAGPGGGDFSKSGMIITANVNNLYLNNINVHGFSQNGILGTTGGFMIANNLTIRGNGLSGWSTDGGDGLTGWGTFNVTNFDISWNGCVEEYPIVDTVPYENCTDQSTGGYGDGFGTASVASPVPGWQVSFSHGLASYNTQDGLDAKHVGSPGSSLNIDHTLAYGSEGQQFKGGFGAPSTMTNNLIVGNCEAIPTTVIPGRPIPTGDSVGNWCRAGNSAVLINTTPGQPSIFQYNTLFSAGYVGVEIEYATSDFGSTNFVKFNNNIFYGFYNDAHQENAVSLFSNGGPDGSNPGNIYPSAIPSVFSNAGGSWTNNATYGSNISCPQSGESAYVCQQPGLVDQTYHAFGYGNMSPASSSSSVSPVIGAGISISGITTDYRGNVRPSLPAIGAEEFLSIPGNLFQTTGKTAHTGR